MSSILMVECATLESSTKMKDNKFVTAAHVSENQLHQDNSVAIALQQEIFERLDKDLHTKVAYIRLLDEPRSTRAQYEGKHECHFVADSISFHNFTNESGEITRRVVILYPMSRGRQGELPREQVIKKLTKKADEEDGSIEIVNLQQFEAEKKYLEGQGSLIFSHDGQFVYMARSTRTNDQVLDVVCSPENLNIPESNRFLFSAEFPHTEKSTAPEPVYRTSLIGWTGKGICAFGFEFLQFPSEEKKEEFYKHIEDNYQKIINLNAKEIRAYAGNACELVTGSEGEERRVLCISDSAMKTLQVRNRKIIEEWYGPENIFVFYADVIQRRCGVSIRNMISNTITHGPSLPNESEQSALEMAKVTEHEHPRN